MKKILVLIGFIIVAYHFNAKAQGPAPLCKRSTCVVVDEMEIGFDYFYSEEDSLLNTSSSLEDLITRKSKVCFRGSSFEVASILTALTRNSEKNYDEGVTDTLTSSLINEVWQDKFQVTFKTQRDYRPSLIIEKKFFRCVD